MTQGIALKEFVRLNLLGLIPLINRGNTTNTPSVPDGVSVHATLVNAYASMATRGKAAKELHVQMIALAMELANISKI